MSLYILAKRNKVLPIATVFGFHTQTLAICFLFFFGIGIWNKIFFEWTIHPIYETYITSYFVYVNVIFKLFKGQHL